MTPEQIRFKNFIQPNEFPYKQINHYTYDSGDYPATLNKALEMLDIQSWRKKQKALRDQGKHIGIGVTFTIEPAGVAVRNCQMGGITQARVKMAYDGTVEVHSDRTEIGQGADKSHAIIVSDILGCNIEDVLVVPVTSDWIGQGPLSSRGAVYCASAVAKATKLLREKVLRYASLFLEEKPEDIDTGDGRVYSKNAPNKQLTYKELAQKTYFFPGPRGLSKEILKDHDHLLDVTATWYSDVTAETGATYTTFCCSADVAVVEVDTDTGETKVQKYVHVHDAGKVTDKQIVDGQIHGGIVQGIGEALSEELVYVEDGQLLNTSHADYLMPTALDAPDISVGHLETPSPFTELGSKGMGEAPIIGGKAVILSAIEDALSPFNVRVNESPATREKVRKWVLEAKR
jgi:carbon-monoxide dehydrogenase large subunit